jgi:hypothetical protein
MQAMEDSKSAARVGWLLALEIRSTCPAVLASDHYDHKPDPSVAGPNVYLKWAECSERNDAPSPAA